MRQLPSELSEAPADAAHSLELYGTDMVRPIVFALAEFQVRGAHSLHVTTLSLLSPWVDFLTKVVPRPKLVQSVQGPGLDFEWGDSGEPSNNASIVVGSSKS